MLLLTRLSCVLCVCVCVCVCVRVFVRVRAYVFVCAYVCTSGNFSILACLLTVAMYVLYYV